MARSTRLKTKTKRPSTSRALPEGPPVRTRLFRNGGSQAVRIPRQFRFPQQDVVIRKEGERLIIEPDLTGGWSRRFHELFLSGGGPDVHFPDREQPAEQDLRESIDP